MIRKLLSISFIGFLSVLLLLSFCFTAEVYAATTGKIQGTVLDAESREPLPGVNVVLEGTIYGAATDANGFFFIINVPPGTYQLTASMVGYAKAAKEDVRIYVDRTTTVDFQLRTEAVAGEEVTVTAERVPVPLDVSATEVYVSGEDMQESAVGRFDQMIALQAGVEFQGAEIGDNAVRQGEGFVVRGGGIDETDIQIDGMSMQDEFTKIPNLAIGRNLIQDVQILTGGFNAEYGNIRSGLINVISKDGSYNRYSGVLEGRYSPAALKHHGFGPYDWRVQQYASMLGPDYRVWDASSYGDDYVGPDQMDGIGSDKVYSHLSYVTAYDTDVKNGVARPGQEYLDDHPYFSSWIGWNSMADDRPYTAPTAAEIFKHEYRGKTYGGSPDQMIDVGFGGPIPRLPRTKFYASQFWNKSFYVIPSAREYSTESTSMFKVTNRIKSNMTLVANFQVSRLMTTKDLGSNYGPTYGYVSGDNTTAGYSGSESHFIFDEANCSPREVKNYYGQLSFTHTYSPKTYYDITVGITRGFNNADVIRRRDLTKIKFIDDPELLADGWKDTKLVRMGGLQPITGYAGQFTPDRYEPVDGGLPVGRAGLDERPNGWWDITISGHGSNAISGKGQSASGGWMDLDQTEWQKISSTTLLAKVNVVSQVNKYNQIKAGIQFNRFFFRHEAYWGYGYRTPERFTSGSAIFGYFGETYRDYSETPMEFDAYIQDKLEWEGLIMNWGIRGTMWFPGVKGYDLTPQNWFSDLWTSKEWLNDDGQVVPGQSNYRWVEQRTRKINHKVMLQPRVGISHPITEASKIFFNYGHFYQRPGYQPMFYVTTNALNVPDVVWPKTISYEIGYSQSIYDQFILQISGYYKDYTNDITTLGIQSYYGDVSYSTQANNGYRDIRGLEFRVERSFGRFFNGWANYNYLVSSSGATGLRYIYENPTMAEEQWNTFNQPRVDARPVFRASITLRTPIGFGPGPAILGIKPLAEWRVNTIFSWRDGGEFVEDSDVPVAEQNYIQRISRRMVDFYLSKRLARGASLYLNVRNLFNLKYYRANDIYLDSLRFPWTEPAGNDKYGDHDMYYIHKLGIDEWQMWDPNKRDIYFGIRYQF